MLLKDWIEKEGITMYRMAKNIGCNPSYIYLHFSAGHKISPKYAVIIEKVTKGEVTKMEALFPEDFVEKKGKMEQMTIFAAVGGK